MLRPNLQQFSNSVARILFLLLYISTYPSTSGEIPEMQEKGCKLVENTEKMQPDSKRFFSYSQSNSSIRAFSFYLLASWSDVLKYETKCVIRIMTQVKIERIE